MPGPPGNEQTGTGVDRAFAHRPILLRMTELRGRGVGARVPMPRAALQQLRLSFDPFSATIAATDAPHIQEACWVFCWVFHADGAETRCAPGAIGISMVCPAVGNPGWRPIAERSHGGVALRQVAVHGGSGLQRDRAAIPVETVATGAAKGRGGVPLHIPARRRRGAAVRPG
jgi:hypothetical protein